MWNQGPGSVELCWASPTVSEEVAPVCSGSPLVSILRSEPSLQEPWPSSLLETQPVFWALLQGGAVALPLPHDCPPGSDRAEPGDSVNSSQGQVSASLGGTLCAGFLVSALWVFWEPANVSVLHAQEIPVRWDRAGPLFSRQKGNCSGQQ